MIGDENKFGFTSTHHTYNITISYCRLIKKMVKAVDGQNIIESQTNNNGLKSKQIALQNYECEGFRLFEIVQKLR
jgi:hypothetical protein